MKINFTPFTKSEREAIMEKRKQVPSREQLYTSGGTKVYMFTLPKEGS